MRACWSPKSARTVHFGPMGIARNLEERIERLIDGMSAAMFRGKVQPADLGSRLTRFADLRVEETWVGPAIPNVYRLTVTAAEMPDPDADQNALDRLGAELTEILRLMAVEEGWATGGPIEVTVHHAADGSGKSLVESGTVPGPIRPWGQLIAVRRSGAHPLGDNRVGVGRATEADIRIDIPEISRRHAVVFRRAGGFWIADLGSTNGTWVNGARIAEPVSLSPGDNVRFGPATFTFRTLQ